MREYPIKAVVLGAVMLLAVQIMVVEGWLLFFVDHLDAKITIDWKGDSK